MTEADELVELGFYSVPGQHPAFYCWNCGQMFWFRWDNAVEQAAKHRETCGE